MLTTSIVTGNHGSARRRLRFGRESTYTAERAARC